VAVPVTQLGDSLLRAYVSVEAVQLKQTSKASPTTVDSIHLVEYKVMTHFSDEEKVECRQWVLDMGVTNHMMGCKSTFYNTDLNIHGTVKFRDGSVVRIEVLGTMLFSCKNGEHRTFTGVYFIPRLTTNIISVGQLDEIGFQTVIEGGVMKIRDANRRLLAKVLWSTNHLYVLTVELAMHVCLSVRGGECAWLWHAHFGLLNFLAMHKLARDDMVRGLLGVDQVDQVCTGCLIGKHQRTCFPHQAEYSAEEILEMVHGDLCGPISLATPSGSRYFLLLINDSSHFMWL
jgi:hypothetical protein